MKVMRRDGYLHSSLPETAVFSIGRFIDFMRRYGAVIVKPTYGSGGAGVVKVSNRGKGNYLIESGTRKRLQAGEHAAASLIKQMTKGKSYVVQRYIPLLTIGRRPVDFRVMVQRKGNVPWTATGKLAKVAGANQIITNVARSRGYVLPAAAALRRTHLRSKAPAILARMDSVGLRAARQLGAAYGFRIIGFDMAVDREGRTWILESNSKPALSLFLKLKDRSHYRRILSFR